jgi:hypothetical protein
MVKIQSNFTNGVREIVPFLILISTVTNVANFGLQITKLNYLPQKYSESPALSVKLSRLIQKPSSPSF